MSFARTRLKTEISGTTPRSEGREVRPFLAQRYARKMGRTPGFQRFLTCIGLLAAACCIPGLPNRMAQANDIPTPAENTDELPLRLNTGGHTNFVTGLAFVPLPGDLSLEQGGRERLISASLDQSVRLWSPDSDIAPLTSGFPRTVPLRYNSDDSSKGEISCLAYDPATKRIALGCKARPGSIGKANSAEILIIDADGKILQSLPNQCKNNIRALAFSGNGKYLAACDEGDGQKSKKKVFVYATDTWEAVKDLEFTGSSLAFSPTDAQLAIGGIGDQVRLLDVQSGKSKLITLPLKNGRKNGKEDETPEDVTSIAWSRKGYLVVSDAKGRVFGRENEHSQFVILKDYQIEVKCLAFDPAGEHLAVSLNSSLTQQGRVEIVKVATNNSDSAFVTHDPVMSLAFSGQGETLAGGDAAGEIHLWQWKNPKETENALDLKGNGHSVYSLRWSKDSSILAWSGEGRSAQPTSAFDLKGMRTAALAEAANLAEGNAQLRIDDRTASSLGAKNAFTIEHGSKEPPFSMGIYDAGSEKAYLVTNELSPVIEEYDVHTQAKKPKRTRVFSGFSGLINTLCVSPDRRYLAAGTSDQVTRLWSLSDPNRKLDAGQSIKPLISLFVGQNQQWVAWNQEIGFYTASDRGDDIINYQFNDTANKTCAEVVPVSICRSAYYNPLCLCDLFQSATIKTVWDKKNTLPSKSTLQQQIRLRPKIEPGKILVKNLRSTDTISKSGDEWETNGNIVLVDAKSAVQSSGANDHVTIQIQSTNSGRSIRGKYTGDPTAADNTADTGPLPANAARLYPGMNTLYIVASEDGNISSTPCPIRINCLSKQVHRGVLHVLSIGVSSYTYLRPDQQLHYAHADAIAIKEFFDKQKGGLYSDVDSVPLIEANANRENIQKALEALKARVKPDDTIVFFVAGHGLEPKDTQEIDPDYFFAPSDFKEDQLDTAVSWKYIISKLAEAQARHTILFVDHCFAGGITKVQQSNVKVRATTSIYQALETKGFLTFMASSANEESNEDAEWGHGAFTYALLETLAGIGYELKDARDGTVKVSDIDHAIGSKVQKLLSRIPRFKGSSQTPTFLEVPGLSSDLLNLPIAKLPVK